MPTGETDVDPLTGRKRCPVCHTTGFDHHEPGSEFCLLVARERRESQRT